MSALTAPSAAAEAVASARAALAQPWPRHARAAALDAAARAVAEPGAAESLAQTICAEVGKPIVAARGEVERVAATLAASAEVARSFAGEQVPLDAVAAGAGKLAFTERVPVGVVVAITPFNFPANLVAHKLGPALAMGNAVVLKPAEQAPRTGAALVALLHEAGVPAERLQLLQGDGDVGAALCAQAVEAITFTGSASVGWQIRAAAPRARVLLELGSTAPLIVCADADVEAAAAATARHGFSYAGQSCISIQRALVDEAVLDAYLAALVPAVERLVLGEPSSEATQVGPLVSAEACDRVEAWVAAALDGGGRLLTGGERIDARTYAPTVVADCPLDASLWREEVFGPVVAVRGFAGLEEAIALANDSAFGLQAGVYSASLETALTAARELDFGAVLVNEAPTFRLDHAPYGGVRDSGTGKEGPAWAARELSDERLIVLQSRPA